MSKFMKPYMRRMRRRLGLWLGAESDWLWAHVAHCPRCQRRLQRAGLVELALSLMRAEPHAIDLTARANAQAIGTLQRSLRDTPQSRALLRVRPVTFLSWPGWARLQPLAGAAACLLMILLIRGGLFHSVKTAQRCGRDAMHTYYAQRLGQDLADEIFTT
jgi:hypothetical protein